MIKFLEFNFCFQSNRYFEQTHRFAISEWGWSWWYGFHWFSTRNDDGFRVCIATIRLLGLQLRLAFGV